jgi:hypothetical protein
VAPFYVLGPDAWLRVGHGSSIEVLAPTEAVTRWIAAAAGKLPPEPVLIGKTPRKVSAYTYEWTLWRAGIAELADVVEQASAGERGEQVFLCSTALTDVDRVRNGEDVRHLGVNGCPDFGWTSDDLVHGVAPLLAGHTPLIVHTGTGERVRHTGYTQAYDEFSRQVRKECVAVAEYEGFSSRGHVYRELLS